VQCEQRSTAEVTDRKTQGGNEVEVARLGYINQQGVVKHDRTVVADGRDQIKTQRQRPAPLSYQSQTGSRQRANHSEEHQESLPVPSGIRDRPKNRRRHEDDQARGKRDPPQANCRSGTTITRAPVIPKYQWKQDGKDTERKGGVRPIVERPGNNLCCEYLGLRQAGASDRGLEINALASCGKRYPASAPRSG